jgi:hypothetical protein
LLSDSGLVEICFPIGLIYFSSLIFGVKFCLTGFVFMPLPGETIDCKLYCGLRLSDDEFICINLLLQ